jgi:acetoin utilization deacetylase AcuC-like enzyme
MKPALLMQYLRDNGFGEFLTINDTFEPFTPRDFQIAHTKRYVKDVFTGVGQYKSNGLPWSLSLVDSLTYTNASLYEAMLSAIERPSTITFSPTSGFHHAKPDQGSGFCTFSGQVIAATKIYRETGNKAAFLDLDGHFGNSIEDSKRFVSDLREAIPFNINPQGSHAAYLKDFTKALVKLTKAFLNNEVHYVVWCHGADSHEWDQLGHQCSTEEWLRCSEIFYAWVAAMESEHQIIVPVTLSLFGGYRDDDYTSVLSLHASDLRICLSRLCGVEVDYLTVVNPKSKYTTLKKATTTLSEAIVEDFWDLQQLTAREICNTVEDVMGIKIKINPKNKQRVIKHAYKLLIENDYV